MTVTELEKARAEIDEIDRSMGELFVKRMHAAARAASAKRALGLPIEDLCREKEILNSRAAEIGDAALRPFFLRFLENNVALSKEYQRLLSDETGSGALYENGGES